MNPNFLSHAYDRRVMIEGMRQLVRLFTAPIFKEKTVQYIGPVDNSDDAIWVSTSIRNFTSARMLQRDQLHHLLN